MPGRFFDWLDHRTGFRALRDALLLEHIPGGAKWRYVWGSTLAFVFAVQLITGVLLMTAYSPGDNSAWGSVFFIQYEMDFGWFIRGLHHFGSQTMVVLLAVHMLQVVIAGAHLPPREVNWWLGLGLMGIVLGLSLTGYLLPWDQKGYYATQVATNILGNTPGVGPFLQKVIVGGPTYGNQTLTHFYALHVGILPPLLIVLLVAHVAIFRRHGITAPPRAIGESYFWPDQAFRDMVVCLIVFGVMVALVVKGHGHALEKPADAPEQSLYESIAKAGRSGLGANLDAPADPAKPYPARPEWYFLFLFQLLKYFEGDQEVIGTLVIPNAVMVILFILPLLGHGRMRVFGHFIGLVFVVSLLATVGMLTALALAADSPEPYPFNLGGGSEQAKKLHEEFAAADEEAQRAIQIAAKGIPPEGAQEMARQDRDERLRGREVFKQTCTACHGTDPALSKAADLTDFGTKKWIRGLLANPGDKAYFGNTSLTGMKKWREKIDAERDKWRQEGATEADKKIAEQDAALDAIAQFLGTHPEKVPDEKSPTRKGYDLFVDSCERCHAFKGDGGDRGPDLTGYGGENWMRLMLMNPASPQRHGKNNKMPAFRPNDDPGDSVARADYKDWLERNEMKLDIVDLSNRDREFVVRYLVKDEPPSVQATADTGQARP